MPVIAHWNFSHFFVVEGFGKDVVYLSDPARGRTTVTSEEFARSFTGLTLAFEPGPSFQKGGQRRT